MSVAVNLASCTDPSKSILQWRQALKLALSMLLFYWLALITNWDVPQYGGLAIVIVSLGTSGATIRQGFMRLLGTLAGVAVGFFVIGLFSHDRWAMMSAFAVYLTLIGYFMQGSRYSYAWYAAAFVPLVVWGDNHPHFEKAFYFGAFRCLETAVGALIYTMVDLVLWPRSAGSQLIDQGRTLFAELRNLFSDYRQQLRTAETPDESNDRRSTVAGRLSQTLATLQNAYADTPQVHAQRRVWEVWRVNVRACVDALELWHVSFDDCRALQLDHLLPELDPVLDMLDKRLERIGNLWQTRIKGDAAVAGDRDSLMEARSLDLQLSQAKELSHFDRAALMSFVSQLETLEQASRELLQTTRVLAGIEPHLQPLDASLERHAFASSRWDPDRLLQALFPSVAFIVAFIFWILVNPPTGPKIPMFAGIISLVVLRTPMNPLKMMVLLLLSIVLIVSPIYWLVMPSLNSGFALLSLIFVFSLICGYLGGRSPAFKSGPMIMFVTMTGISNQQSYSFQGPVDGALMMVLAVAIVTAIYFMFTPLRPEDALLRAYRRFMRGCARVTAGFDLSGAPQSSASRRLRKRYLQTMVLPGPAMLLKAQSQLSFAIDSETTQQNANRLHDSLQRVSYRLQALDLVSERCTLEGAEYRGILAAVGKHVDDILPRVFDRWEHFALDDAFAQERDALQQLAVDVQRQLNILEAGSESETTSDRARSDLYTMLGSVRALVEAMAGTQAVISQINWHALATTRF